MWGDRCPAESNRAVVLRLVVPLPVRPTPRCRDWLDIEPSPGQAAGFWSRLTWPRDSEWPTGALGHGESCGAGRNSSWSRDLDLAGFCTGRNRGRDLSIGVNRERGRFHSPERDLGCTREAGAGNRHLGSNRPTGRVETQDRGRDPEYFVAG